MDSKYWNLPLSGPDQLRATSRQLALLRKLSGEDMRERSITRGQASALIDELKAKSKPEK